MSADYADRLLSLPRYSELGNAAMKPGLRGVGHLLSAMGHPEQNFASVHIAGTNGKGSIASIIAAIGQSAGYRIGLYTSPPTPSIRTDSVKWCPGFGHLDARRSGSLRIFVRPSTTKFL